MGLDTAQGGEGSLGVEAVRVTPGSNEEGRRRVWSYAEAIHQGWGCRPCESLDLGLQVLYLITELTVATGKESEEHTWPPRWDPPYDQAGSSWTG